ncbi:hypothetical protein Tco_0045823 [Tanacetum coccineum]
MVEKPVLNNKGRVTGQREIRPVWNNAQRVNHQNKFTHPHPKRNFVPTVVVTKSGQVLVNTTKQSSPKAATSISTVRPVNTAAPKPKVNDALPITYSYFKAHSPVKRAFNQKLAAKTNKFNEKVNTARVNNVTTAGPKAVVSAAIGNGENADKGIFDSGCSRHMTGNKSFLTDYQEIDGGFVAFRGSLKGASTTIETHKAFLKDEEAEDVDVHSYRSMIGSLMYLTASRPDIMFAVCACARFQVTPKVSHLHVVKRIFRYLKGQPKLGLWYPRDSPFELEAFSNGDYTGASLDRKSTTGAEYVAAVNCCGQVLWIQNQMLDYGFNFMNTKIYIDNESTICIVKNPVFHSKTKHIEIRHHFIRDSYEKRLIQSGGPPEKVGDKVVHKKLGDRMERAATTASILEAEHDNGNINRTQSMATLNEPSPFGTGSGSGLKCQDTILEGV